MFKNLLRTAICDTFRREVSPGYREGAGEWKRYANHDSCWPDGIDRIFREYNRKLNTFAMGDWYEVVDWESLHIESSCD